MPCTRVLFQSVQTFVESHCFTQHFTAAFRQTQKNILIEVRLNKCLVYKSKSHSRAIARRRRTQKPDTVGANVLPKSIPSRCLKPRATSHDLSLTTHPCLSTIQVYTHLASITFSADCYIGAKVPACSRPWNSLFMECRHISACDDVSASNTLPGVCRSDTNAFGRYGEVSCWRMISCAASPLVNIDTKAAWSNGRPWRWAYFRDASRIARVSPRILLGVSTYSSCASLRLTRGGIGAGELDLGTGGGDVGGAGVGAGARTGVGDGAGAEKGGTGAGAGAANLGTAVGIGT